MAERGRALLKDGEYERALLNLEKSLALDPNPYLYYDLARVHHHLAQYRESTAFADAAQAWLMDQPQSAAALQRLTNENRRALAKQAAAVAAVEKARAAESRSERQTSADSSFMAHFLAAGLALGLLYVLTVAARKFEGKSKLRLNFPFLRDPGLQRFFWR